MSTPIEVSINDKFEVKITPEGADPISGAITLSWEQVRSIWQTLGEMEREVKRPDLKYMNITEFRASGFLQEVNRIVLHPAGLALEIMAPTDGEVFDEYISGVWDYRGDDEGMYYGAGVLSVDKFRKVEEEQRRHRPTRCGMFGGSTGIQPLPDEVEPDL